MEIVNPLDVDTRLLVKHTRQVYRSFRFPFCTIPPIVQRLVPLFMAEVSPHCWMAFFCQVESHQNYQSRHFPHYSPMLR